MLPDECVWIISVLSQSGRSIPGGIIHKNSPCDRKTFLSSQLEPKLPYVQCRVWKKLEVSSWFVFFWWVLKNKQKMRKKTLTSVCCSAHLFREHFDFQWNKNSSNLWSSVFFWFNVVNVIHYGATQPVLFISSVSVCLVFLRWPEGAAMHRMWILSLIMDS